jgi:zinc protease
VSGGPALRVRRLGGAPVVAVRALAAGGARAEPAPARALLSGRLLDEGSRRRDWRRIATDADARGAVVSSWGAYESIGVAIDALASDWERALEWAAELLLEPVFPEDRLALLARQAAAELESQADQADALTGREFMAQVYAPHPRGRPLQGDPESLARIAPGDCRDFHSVSLRRGVVVAVAGEIDAEAVAALAERLFDGVSAPTGIPAAAASPPPPAPTRREIVTRAHDQAHLFLGRLTVTRAHPDYEALELASVVLGAGTGLTGRIPQRIREREGLAYTAAADAVAGAGLDPGRLYAYVGTSPETVARAERGVIEELSRFHAEGPTAEELDEARSYLLGREPFRRETARQWADLAAVGALYGLPLEDPRWSVDRVAATTAAEVAAAVARHLDPAVLAVTVGLPAAD